MSIISVSSTAGLLSAIKTAQSGDIISLAGGTYSDVNIRYVNKAGITIQSADTNKPAVLTDLMLRDSSGFTFRDVTFEIDPVTGHNAVQIYNSRNVVMDKIDVHGTLNGNPQDDTSAFAIRFSTNVTVTNSYFHELKHGVNLGDSNYVTLTNNRFEDLRTDGIRGGGTSNLLIAGNYFTDIYPIEGDHADAIQLWTTNTTVSAHDIVIKDNVFNRGDGHVAQGIFLRDQLGNLPFLNVTIENNTIVGGNANGIAVDGAKGLTINNNEVIAIDGSKSWIRVDRVSDAVVSRNSANTYLYAEDSQVVKSDNVMIGTISAADAKLLDSWLDLNSATLADLVRRLDTPLTSLIKNLALLDGGLTSPLLSVATTTLTGTDGKDKLKAGEIGKFKLLGGDGDDILTGNGTGTEMHGGKGNDAYGVNGTGDIVVELPAEGIDTVNSTISYTLSANIENLRLMEGELTGRGNNLDNRMIGSSGDDILYGEGGEDLIQAGAGNDKLYGGAGSDDLRGDAGNDVIYGGDGNDKLLGSDGGDILYGEAGNDTLRGGAGADRLNGGSGADSFVLENGDFALGVSKSMDTIMDFSRAQGDRISLSGVDAIASTTVDDRFKFIGADDFSKVAGQLRYTVAGGNSYVLGDTNGDGVADLAVLVAGVSSLAGSDFIL